MTASRRSPSSRITSKLPEGATSSCSRRRWACPARLSPPGTSYSQYARRIANGMCCSASTTVTIRRGGRGSSSGRPACSPGSHGPRGAGIGLAVQAQLVVLVECRARAELGLPAVEPLVEAPVEGALLVPKSKYRRPRPRAHSIATRTAASRAPTARPGPDAARYWACTTRGETNSTVPATTSPFSRDTTSSICVREQLAQLRHLGEGMHRERPRGVPSASSEHRPEGRKRRRSSVPPRRRPAPPCAGSGGGAGRRTAASRRSMGLVRSQRARTAPRRRSAQRSSANGDRW